jgi:hypothetical protein
VTLDGEGALDDKFAHVLARVQPGARLRGVRALRGGLSAQMVLLEAEGADGTLRRLIVRRATGGGEHGTSLSSELDGQIGPVPRLAGASLAQCGSAETDLVGGE